MCPASPMALRPCAVGCWLELLASLESGPPGSITKSTRTTITRPQLALGRRPAPAAADDPERQRTSPLDGGVLAWLRAPALQRFAGHLAAVGVLEREDPYRVAVDVAHGSTGAAASRLCRGGRGPAVAV